MIEDPRRALIQEGLITFFVEAIKLTILAV